MTGKSNNGKAKKKASGERHEVAEPEMVPETVAVEPEEAPPETITLPPLGPLPEKKYTTRHIDIHLDVRQRNNLRRLYDALHDRHERLDGGRGRHVESAGDAVRWLLEQIAEEGKRQ